MSHNTKEIIFQPSTIETIDYAFYRWLDEEMNLHCTTHNGWEKTNVLWVSSERVAQIKQNKEIRDKEGSLILPLITVERTSMDKDPSFKGIVQAHMPNVPDYKGGTFIGAKILNQDKTSNFANAQSYRTSEGNVGQGQINFRTKKEKPPVNYLYTFPLPVWLKINYQINVKTEHQQQINELLQPFIVHAGQITSFFINHEGHKYECFFEPSFGQENNVSSMGEEERKFESVINIRTLGYLMGSNKNDKYPKKTLRENAVEFKIQRERTITEDSPEHTNLIKKYRM